MVRLGGSDPQVRTGHAGLKVTPAVSAEEIRRHLRSSFDFSEPRPLPELTTEMARLLRRWNVQIVRPRHFGLFNPSVPPAGVVADTLTALFNPQLGAWWYSSGANEIEIHTLDFFLKRLGFDPATSAAHFTSGGSEANTSAVLVALTAAFPAYAQDGLAGAPAQPTIYLSEEAHDSFAKIAHHAGLGRRALRRVTTDANPRLDPADLTRQVNEDRKSGKRPFLVVGTAGTTRLPPRWSARSYAAWQPGQAARMGMAALRGRVGLRSVPPFYVWPPGRCKGVSGARQARPTPAGWNPESPPLWDDPRGGSSDGLERRGRLYPHPVD
jgi:hypothetical protein